MRLEELFGVSRRITIAIIASSVLFATGMLHVIMKPKPEETYQIIKDGKYHLTSDPIKAGNCVTFTDEDGLSREICSPFSMKRI